MNDDGAKGVKSGLGAGYAHKVSPDEALRIRRILTLYLASLIRFPDDHLSHLGLCHPEAALEVKSIPREVVGIRRQYLKEIQANIKARQDYQDLLASAKRGDEGVAAGAEIGAGANKLETHLKLLQVRKRYKEVQIVRHYLEELKKTNPAKDGGLDFRSTQTHEDEEAQLAFHERLDSATSPGERTQALMEKLERAVLRAKYQLEREKGLLAEVQDQHAKSSSNDRATDPTARVAALSATRDELIRFLEEKMSKASLEDDGVPIHVHKQGDKAASNGKEEQEQIKAEYDRYIEARKRVLEAASKALYTAPALGSANPASQRMRQAAEERVHRQPPAAHQAAISTLPFVSEQLLPLLHHQRASALQKAYLAKVLVMERAKALESLERLSDESHLLPAYPILARQERFKNVAAAMGGPRKLGQVMVGLEESDEVIRWAEAWVFAAEEAKRAEEQSVKEKVRFANERLDGVEQTLASLDPLLGSDLQGSELAGDGSDETDIWLEAAGGAPPPPHWRRLRPGREDRGPWKGLNGRIGVVQGKKS